MTTESIEKIPAIFVIANFGKDRLWRSYTPDLIAFLKRFDKSSWRNAQLHEDYEGCNMLVYWKQVDLATLEQEGHALRMLTKQELNKLIEAFNPAWNDFYDIVLPKPPGIVECPNCGEKIPVGIEE